MHKKTQYIILLIIISISLCSCNKTSAPSQLRLSLPNKVKTFDPAKAFDDTSLNILGQSLDTLYQYHYLKRPYEVIPSLAQSMPITDDEGKIYTIKIKKNVQYHDHIAFKGKRYLKAQDFIVSIKRHFFKPTKSVGAWILDDKLVGVKKFKRIVGDDFDKMLNTPIEGLTAIDDYTLKIELLRPDPNLLYYLSMYFTSPIPIELIKYTKNDLKKTLVGTGAYFLKSYSDNLYEFEKFKEYRFEKYPSVGDRYANTQNLLSSSSEKMPFINSLKFEVIEDEEKQWEHFLEGKIDIINCPKKYLEKISKQDSSLMKMLKEKNVEVKFFSKLATRWLGFNMQDPLIGNSYYLRKAIAHAINFDMYLETISNNTNLRANSILHPSIKGYRPTHSSSFKYDLDLAKKYLEKAGFPNGEGLPTLIFSTRGDKQINLDEANFFKNQLEKIGLKIELEVLTFSKFIKNGRRGKLKHLWVDNWIYDYPDAENMLQLLISKNVPGINKSKLKNIEIDKLYEQLISTINPKKRLEIIYNIEDIVYKTLPWIMIMYESSYILQNKSVKNYRKSYFIKNNVKYLKKY